MSKKLSFLMILSLSWLTTWAMGPGVAVAARQAATIRPDPLAVGLKPNTEGTVSIVIQDVQELYGVEFQMTFDPNIVEVVDADPTQPGVQIQSGDWFKDAFVAVNRADNATGSIDYAVTLLNPAPPLAGSGSLGVITFKAKGEGMSTLKIEKTILATREAQEIQVERRDGALGVSASGQAPDLNAPTNVVNDSASSLTENNTALIVVAGLGALAFLIALGVLVGAIWLRRR